MSTARPAAPTLVCAWCPDKDKRTRAVEAAGHSVTHGICRGCYAQVLGEDEVDFSTRRASESASVAP